MSLTVEAVYENGVLKPKQPLELAEGSEVRLTIGSVSDNADPLASVIGIGDGPSEGDGAQEHDKYIYGKTRP